MARAIALGEGILVCFRFPLFVRLLLLLEFGDMAPIDCGFVVALDVDAKLAQLLDGLSFPSLLVPLFQALHVLGIASLRALFFLLLVIGVLLLFSTGRLDRVPHELPSCLDMRQRPGVGVGPMRPAPRHLEAALVGPSEHAERLGNEALEGGGIYVR